MGDFAYDFMTDNGTNGDLYMQDMEPIYSAVPSVTCPGNHEASQYMNHYTNRFQNQPTNSGNLWDAGVKFSQFSDAEK